LSKSDFRRFLPPHDHGKIVGSTARAHAEAKLKGPRAQELFSTWRKMLNEPFKSITTAGKVIPDLFSLRHEDAPTAAMVDAANQFLAQLSSEQRAAACLKIDSTIGVIGRTRKFMSTGTGCDLRKLNHLCARQPWRCCAPGSVPRDSKCRAT